MIFDTVTEFIEHYEHCYDMGELSWLLEDYYVYLCKATGNIEVYDRELDYQYTLLPWVALTGRARSVVFPPIEPTLYDR